MPERDYFMHGWLSEENKRNLAGILADFENPLVFEIGTWLGMSAKFMLDLRKDLKLVTIDSFEGSEEHFKNKEWRQILKIGLQEGAQRNLWNYQKRCCILENYSIYGLIELFREGVWPDLIYIDGSHVFIDVYMDISLSLLFFKKAIVCGDDVNLPSVRAALSKIQKEENISSVYENGSFWRIFR